MYRDRFKTFGTALTVSFCVLGLTACVSSSESTYGEDTAPDKKLIGAMLGGIGLVDQKTKPIDYKPRAPLALPPSTGTLPQPEAGTTDVANWPRDKDAELAAIAAEADKAYYERARHENTPALLNSRELAELPELPSSSNSSKKRTSVVDENRRTGTRLSPAEVAALKERKANLASLEEQANQGCGKRGNKLNKRCFLIEPPIEYNKTADSAPVPEVAAGAEFEEEKKPTGDELANPRNVNLN